MAERQGLERAGCARARRGALRAERRALHPPPPAGTREELGRLPRALHRAEAHPRRLRFWQRQRGLAGRAEALYGVPAEIVVGIVGVETIYGRRRGASASSTRWPRWPSIFRARPQADRSDSFAASWSTSSSSPGRTTSIRSAAGAPSPARSACRSSCRAAAKVGRRFRRRRPHRPAARRGRRDRLGGALPREHGWIGGLATHFPVAAPVEVVERATLLVPDIVPSFSVEQIARPRRGARADARGLRGELALVELQNGDAAPSSSPARRTSRLTRYNWSGYYAMAVIELGAAVARERGR